MVIKNFKLFTFFLVLNILIVIFNSQNISSASLREANIITDSDNSEIISAPILSVESQKRQVEVNENQYFGFYVTCEWEPPAPERPICLWPGYLPTGSSFPMVSGSGSVTSTFTWRPNYCQAGFHQPLFLCGESCGSPQTSISVDINVSNVNRPPSLNLNPSRIVVKEGELVTIEVQSNDSDEIECGDDSTTFNTPGICGSAGCSFFDDYSKFFYWQTGALDSGYYSIPSNLTDEYGGVDFAVFEVEVLEEGISGNSSRNKVNITYQGVCTENCTKMVFIQSVCRYAKMNDGTNKPYIPSQEYGPWAVKNKDVVDGGKNCSIDRALGFDIPYYGTNNDGSPRTTSRHGVHRTGNISNATMWDGPETQDPWIKRINTSLGGGVKGVYKEFETCVYCAQGKDAGKFYGCIKWNYKRNHGDAGAGNSTIDGNTSKPSVKFNESLQKFVRNHNFTLPSKSLFGLLSELNFVDDNQEIYSKLISDSSGSQFKITYIGPQEEIVQSIGLSTDPFNLSIFELYQNPGINYFNDMFIGKFTITAIESSSIMSSSNSYMVSEPDPSISFMRYNSLVVQEALLDRSTAMDLLYEVLNDLDSSNTLARLAVIEMLLQLDLDGDVIPDSIDNCWYVYNPSQSDSNSNCPSTPFNSDPQCGDACEPEYVCGNVDGVVGPGGPVDVSDLTYLVAYLFSGGSSPTPLCVANVDGVVGPGGPVDVSDLTYLVAYLFSGGSAPSSNCCG